MDKSAASDAMEEYYAPVPKERRASWYAPIISTIGFPERLSPEIIEENIKIAEALKYANEEGEPIDLTEDVKLMQESVKVFGGDTRELYEKDLFYIVGKEPTDKDILEEKRKLYMSPNEKGEVPRWYWKGDEKWELYKDDDLQLTIELHYKERRPNVRVDEDHYVAFSNMKQYRYDNEHKKRRVKRELEKVEGSGELKGSSDGEKEKDVKKNDGEEETGEKQEGELAKKSRAHGKTVVRVMDDDCLGVALSLESEVGARPLVLNLAQRWSEHVCGGWSYAYKGSQEEWIERHSAVYRLGLDPKLNPYFADIHRKYNYDQLPRNHIPEFGAVYHAHVPVIRARDYHFMKKPHYVDVVAAGAIDLRHHVTSTRDHERDYYVKEKSISDSFNSLPWVRHNKRATLMKEDKQEEEEGTEPHTQYPEKDLEEQGLDGALFDEHTRMKIRIVLSCAVALGYRHLVLGALGCGAFMNPTRRVATLFKECLTEKRFRGCFDIIVFAILGEGNAAPFSEVFSEGEL